MCLKSRYHRVGSFKKKNTTSRHVIPGQRCQCGSGETGPSGLYLVSLLAAGDGTGERLLLAPVHAHGAEDGLGADGTFSGPRFIAVRLLVVYLLLVILAAWGHSGDTQKKKYASHPR